MEVRNYKKILQQQLGLLYDKEEIEAFFYLILEEFHHLRRIDLALNPFFCISLTDMSKWDTVILQLKDQKPIQYILGNTEFYGLSFIVNTDTLIPRSETEELIEWILQDIDSQENKNIKILDIGTGTGCIAISLAKNIPNACVYAIDISEKALQVAKKNAIANKVSIRFVNADILTTTHLEETFDIIVSNPPYVRNLEKKEIKKNVLDFEPHLALFVPDDNALLFYDKITKFAKNNLTKNGKLYFEINQYLGQEMIVLLQENNFKNIQLKQDIYSANRMICGIYTE
jgi:release factor glutamine methyltransferase